MTEEKADMAGLLKRAADKSKEGRKSLVDEVSDLYFESGQVFSERETELVASILNQLVSDVDVSVRRALAERLADRPDAPRELVLRLANDEIEVAHPVLVRSLVLQDRELLEIIRHQTSRHQLAITMREALGAEVSDALVATGDSTVIQALLENSSAQISEEAITVLVDQARFMERFQAPLLARHELTANLAKRLYWWVATSYREKILDRYKIDSVELDDIIDATVKELITDYRIAKSRKEAETSELIDQLAMSKLITPDFLIRVLRAREVPLFEALFGKLTNLPVAAVRRIVYEPPGFGLAIACRSLDLHSEEFGTLFLLSRQGRPGDQVVDSGELEIVMEFFARFGRAKSLIRLEKWRTDPGYFAAIQDFKDEA